MRRIARETATLDMTKAPTITVHTSQPGTATAPLMRIAVFGDAAQHPELVNMLFAAEWSDCRQADMSETESDSFVQQFDVAVLVDRGSGSPDKPGPRFIEQERQLELLRRRRLGVLILTSRPWLFAGYGFGTVCLPRDASVEKTHGVLLALSRSQPVMRLIDKQVDSIRRLSENVSRLHEETQGEMRLAAKLQREFLPRELPQTGSLRFASLYRPCSWVSGDIFDIFRLDETRWGMYLADAVGHGMAAGLLTMYIKHAIRPKRISKNSYKLVSPSEVMAELNDRLAMHELRDSQFITGWYGLFDTETLELQYAVAGHPPALHIRPEGEVSELHGDGCILGLTAGQCFSNESVQLEPGDRILAYTDGLEDAFIASRPPLPQKPELVEGAEALLRLPPDELTSRFRERLDSAPGSLSAPDDVTMIVMDVLGRVGE